MSLLTIVVVLIVAGILLFLVNNYLPMDGKIKKILNWVVVIFIIIWLLNAVGAFSFLGKVHI